MKFTDILKNGYVMVPAVTYVGMSFWLNEFNPLDWEETREDRFRQKYVQEFDHIEKNHLRKMGLYNLVFQLADRDGLPGIGKNEALDVFKRATGSNFDSRTTIQLLSLTENQLIKAIESYKSEMKPEMKKEYENLMGI